MSTSSPENFLTGSDLEALLNRLEADCEEGVASEIHLRDRLLEQPLRADSLNAIDRLYTLWVQAGDLTAALAVIENDGALLLQSVPPAAHADLALWLNIVRAQHHGKLAVACQQQNKPEEARAAAVASLAALEKAAEWKKMKVDDWLWAGDMLIEILPERLPLFREKLTALSKKNPLPERRDIEVRIARLAARALYAEGDLAGALAACDDARYSLEPYGSGSDDFIEYELPWLIAAERFDAAGQRAFFHLYEVETLENGAWEGVFQRIPERLSDPAETSVWWSLCAMRACNNAHALANLLSFAPTESDATLKAIFGDFLGREIDRDADNAVFEPIFQAAHTQAEVLAPEHPWTRRLMVARDFESKAINAHAYLEQLEAAARDGKMTDWRTAYRLFEARMIAHGVMKALTSPPPLIFHLASGLDCLHFGTRLDTQVEAAIATLPEAEQDKAWRLSNQIQIQVYEHGKTRMERYFKTGKGHPHDVGARLYSMLCNNLGKLYRVAGKNAEALEMHHLGITASSIASSIAEHYDGIMLNYWDLGDEAKIVESAEKLWQYAAEHGYSRHNPTKYVRRVAEALYTLERDSEIPLWLERLLAWERENEIDAANLLEDSLYARLLVTFYLARANREQSLAQWQRLRLQAENSTSANVLAVAGDLTRVLGLRKEAIALYERRLILEDNPKTREFLRRLRTEVDAEARANSKSWWQVWK